LSLLSNDQGWWFRRGRDAGPRRTTLTKEDHMVSGRRVMALIIAIGATAGISQAQCPGYNPSPNKNLACAIATSAPSQQNVQGAGQQLAGTVGSTVATQLSQLPIATTVSGAGLVFNSQLGVFEASKDMGPILTQRGDTVGRHKLFISGSYQRFNFNSVDGIDMKKLQIVNQITVGGTSIFAAYPLRVDFRIDQFVGVATFGLTSRVDLSLILPFSKVTIKSQRTSGTLYVLPSGATSATAASLGSNYFPGDATGIGDVTFGVKANIFKSKSEKTSIAIGGMFRAPTGDAINYLGTGAYGLKPYIVISRHGRITPNVSLAYQWNGVSELNVDRTTGKSQSLPSSFMYSGGVDIQVVRRLSIAGELLGQAVINGPRLFSSTTKVDGTTTLPTVDATNSTYSMHNASFGLKVNPFKGLLISGSALVKLDDAGLRANVVPMLGIAYRF